MWSLPLLLLCFYFLPFFTFFFASLWFGSAVIFALGTAGVSISTLSLFLLLKNRESMVKPIAPPISQKQKSLLATQKPLPITNTIFELVKDSFYKTPTINLSHQKEIIDALMEEQETLKKTYDKQIHTLESEKVSLQKKAAEQQPLIETREHQLAEMGMILCKKNEEVELLKTEIANLKFELFALCRIDDQIVTNKQKSNSVIDKISQE